MKTRILIMSWVMLSVAAVAQSSGQPNFYDIQKNFYATHEAPEMNAKEIDRDDEWTRFKRWEWFMQQRVGPGGKLFSPNVLLEEWNHYTAMHSSAVPSTAVIADGGRWQSMGPDYLGGFRGNNGNMGRVSCIRFDPTNSNTLFIGTPEGGMWKTSNTGVTWIPLTDHLPNLGVTDIAIHPTNNKIIYIATGDGDAAGMYGDPYSYGVMKTTNGGVTWDTTGLGYNTLDKILISRLIINPKNPNMIFAGVSGGPGNMRGLWRSIDAGKTWTLVDAGAIYGIEFKPGDAKTMYACGYGNVRKSVDSGATWTTLSSAVLPTYAGNGVSRTAIAVTPASPNVLYYLVVKDGAYNGLYKTIDGGTTWTLQSDSTGRDVVTMQGDYNLVIAVSPTNAGTVIAGGTSLFRSTNSGVDWTSIGFNIHVDQHALIFDPSHPNTVYSGNDGGIYVTTNGGDAFADVSGGLQITQYYRLGCAQGNVDLMYAGAQDNGFHRYEIDGVTNWVSELSGADGTTCVVDYANDSVVYMSYQQGYLYCSTDNGASVNMIAPDTKGNWITPLVLSPTNHKTLYCAFRELFTSTDQGTNWTKISTQLAGSDPMKSLSVAPSNEKYIYMGTYVKIFRTSNGGTTWTDIGAGSPIGDTAALTSICVHPTTPKWAWVTYAGFSAGQKVYKTTDAGATWTNVSGSLPNVSVNCAVYQKGSNDGIYAGTDLGVFYRDNTMNDWVRFGDSMPNVAVMDLQIQYRDRALRAATFGRGVWQTPLRGEQAPPAPALISPANGDTTVPVQSQIVWAARPDAAYYGVEILSDSGTGGGETHSTSDYSNTTFPFAFVLKPGTWYSWHVRSTNLAGTGAWSTSWRFRTAGKTAVEPASAMPQDVTLEQNAPNPFSSSTVFRFAISKAAQTLLTVTNMLGQIVAVPYDQFTTEGTHSVNWNAEEFPAGVYRVQLRSQSGMLGKTMMIVR